METLNGPNPDLHARLVWLNQLHRHQRTLVANRPSDWYCDRQPCDGNPHDRWHWCQHPADAPSEDHTPACRHARTDQHPPSGDWFAWMIQAGRGWGKSRAGAEWLADQAIRFPGTLWMVAAPTHEGLIQDCMESEFGLLHALGLDRSSPEYNRTTGRLLLTNGSEIRTMTAEQPSGGRGPSLSGAWLDEVGSWRYEETWIQRLLPALRSPKTRPHVVITSTPAPTPLVRRFVKSVRDSADQADGRWRLTRGSTYDNKLNLSPEMLEEFQREFEGTRHGRQEIYGELLEDVPGALWITDLIDKLRVDGHSPAFWKRTVCAIDPADGLEAGDEQAICVVSQSADLCDARIHRLEPILAPAGDHHHFYVRFSDGSKMTPWEWINHAIDVTIEYGAELVVEKNHGAGYLMGMIEQALQARQERVPYRSVNAIAGGGKKTRAEGVVGLYEQHRVHHVGTFAKLEQQMTSFTGLGNEKSPDRMDALVWALSEFTSHSLSQSRVDTTVPFRMGATSDGLEVTVV